LLPTQHQSLQKIIDLPQGKSSAHCISTSSTHFLHNCHKIQNYFNKCEKNMGRSETHRGIYEKINTFRKQSLVTGETLRVLARAVVSPCAATVLKLSTAAPQCCHIFLITWKIFPFKGKICCSESFILCCDTQPNALNNTMHSSTTQSQHNTTSTQHTP
jgi:hypothetical protein